MGIFLATAYTIYSIARCILLCIVVEMLLSSFWRFVLIGVMLVGALVEYICVVNLVGSLSRIERMIEDDRNQ